MNVILVPATAELIHEFYGDAKLPSLQAFVVLEDEAPVAVAGFFRGTKHVLFSDAIPGWRERNKKVIVRVTKQLLKIAAEKNWKILALADRNMDGAEHYLERMGFKKTDDGAYIK